MQSMAGTGVSNGNCLVTKLNVDLDSEVTIYPNPSTDSFMLESQDNSTVELFTSQGKLITSYHGVSKLGFGSELQAGIYLVKTGSSVFKIVKE